MRNPLNSNIPGPNTASDLFARLGRVKELELILKNIENFRHSLREKYLVVFPCFSTMLFPGVILWLRTIIKLCKMFK